MDITKYRQMVDENYRSMIEFLGDDETFYTKDDVLDCANILYGYLEALETMEDPDDDKIMEEVKNVVLALNDINECTDMIETVEREAICEIIQESAIECGLECYEDDITEEWRDW